MTHSAAKRRTRTALRVPTPLLAAVEVYAARCGFNHSEAVRALLCSALESCGIWPPAVPDRVQ